jgi:alpha-glucosidase
VYTDEDTLREFGRLTRIYAALAANYTRAAVRQNAAQHTPVMRPLFLMFEDDPQSFLQAIFFNLGFLYCPKAYINNLYCYPT